MVPNIPHGHSEVEDQKYSAHTVDAVIRAQRFLVEEMHFWLQDEEVHESKTSQPFTERLFSRGSI